MPLSRIVGIRAYLLNVDLDYQVEILLKFVSRFHLLGKRQDEGKLKSFYVLYKYFK